MTEQIIKLLQERFVTREELCSLLHTNDRQVRNEIMYLRRTYPIISTSGRKGYKIATSNEDLQLAKQSMKELRNKALTTLKGYKQIKNFIKGFEEIDPQLELEFE